VRVEEVGVEARSWFGSGAMQGPEQKKRESKGWIAVDVCAFGVVYVVWFCDKEDNLEAANTLGFYRRCHHAYSSRRHSQAQSQTSHGKHVNVPVTKADGHHRSCPLPLTKHCLFSSSGSLLVSSHRGADAWSLNIAMLNVISKPPPQPHRYASYQYSVRTLAASTSLGPEGGPPRSQTYDHQQAAACIDPWT